MPWRCVDVEAKFYRHGVAHSNKAVSPVLAVRADVKVKESANAASCSVKAQLQAEKNIQEKKIGSCFYVFPLPFSLHLSSEGCYIALNTKTSMFLHLSGINPTQPESR